MSVYILTCRSLNIAKIGFSLNPRIRTANLKTGIHAPCALEAVIPASQSNEKELHNHFAGSRLQGEWFAITDELIALISRFPCEVAKFGKRLRKSAVTALGVYCDEIGMTDSEFASLVGRDRTIVNKWRNGKVVPTLADAAKVESVTNGEVSMSSWVAGAEGSPQ